MGYNTNVDNLCWYAIHTKPRAEEQARAALVHKGIEVYLPQVRVKRVNPRARTLVALFPRYLFVRVDLEQTGQSALEWTPGVAHLVNFGGVPAAMPAAAIEHVKRRLAELEASGELGLGTFRKGERVRITQGPMRDLDAVFDQQISGRGRARVLVEFLGRVTACEVNAEALEKDARRN